MKKLLLFSVMVLFFAIDNSVFAQTTFSWRNDQNPTSGQWNVDNYWWNGSGAALPGGAEILYLDGSVGLSMTNDLPSTNRYQILFGSGGSSRTVNGTTPNNFYDYGNNRPKIENNSSNNQTIGFPFNFGYSGGMELNPVDGNLTITGAVNRQTRTLFVFTNSSTPKTLFVNSSFSGSGDIYLLNGSTMSIGSGGSISGSGVFYIENGTLTFSTGGAFGSGTDIRISASKQLNLNNVSITARSVAERGTSNGGTINLGSGILTITGGWGTGIVLFQNSISGTGGIVKQGSGTMALYGDQSFTGSISIESEVLSSSSNLSSSLITVSNGATFSATDDISVNSLTLNSGAILNIASGKTLTVNGTLTIKGSYTISGGGTLAYGSNGVLKYEGSSITTTADDVFPASSGPKDLLITDASASGITLHANRTLAGALTISAGEIFIIPATKSLTVNGTLTNTVNTGIVIKSDATGTGSLINSSTGVAATVERYISGAAEAWHLISSPVSGQEISGVWTPLGTYPDGSGYDFYAWHEPSATWLNQKVGANNITSFVPGKGYLVAFQATNPTKTFTGTLNEGIISTTLSMSGPGANGHTNLVGNPYPSSIDWKNVSGIDKSKLYDFGQAAGVKFYIWNETANNYGVYSDANSGDGGTNGTTRYIAPMQGFFVRAASIGDLAINNDARVHSTQAWLKSGNDNSFRLKATAPANYGSDELLLEFGHESSNGGAEKWSSFVAEAPGIYTPKNGKNYSISFLNSVSENPVIPVSFTAGVQGNYTISADFNSDVFSQVSLRDNKTGDMQDMRINPVYSFSATPGDDDNRFSLHFSSVGIDETSDLKAMNAYFHDGLLYVSNTPSNAQITLSTLTGQVVMQRNAGGSGLVTLNAASLPKGVYIVTVQGEGARVSRKVVL